MNKYADLRNFVSIYNLRRSKYFKEYPEPEKPFLKKMV